MAKRKRDPKGRYKSKGRSNPSVVEEFTDTGKNLFMQYGLAALSATSAVKVAEYGASKIPGLPAWAKEWGAIVGPGVAGIIVTMMADKKNAIMQGLAGGMAIATVNGLSDKLIPGNSSSGMADAALETGDMIVKADGMLYDQQGNPIARIAGNEPASKSLPASSGSVWPHGEQDFLGEANWDLDDNWA